MPGANQGKRTREAENMELGENTMESVRVVLDANVSCTCLLSCPLSTRDLRFALDGRERGLEASEYRENGRLEVPTGPTGKYPVSTGRKEATPEDTRGYRGSTYRVPTLVGVSLSAPLSYTHSLLSLPFSLFLSLSSSLLLSLVRPHAHPHRYSLSFSLSLTVCVYLCL